MRVEVTECPVCGGDVFEFAAVDETVPFGQQAVTFVMVCDDCNVTTDTKAVVEPKIEASYAVSAAAILCSIGSGKSPMTVELLRMVQHNLIKALAQVEELLVS